jgi:formylglycine-generating enzyme required for sulfatase activity
MIAKIGLIIVVLLLTGGSILAQEATPEPKAGDTRTDTKGIKQVYVPPGCFMMGSSEAQLATAFESKPPAWAKSVAFYEKPEHEVCLTKGYWIDQYEVTNAAFDAFVKDGGYTHAAYWSKEGAAWLKQQDASKLPVTCEDTADDHPRVCVTWYEAQAYAAWRGGNLPTEAQWEFAARGTESHIYPWGDEWDAAKANVLDSEGLSAVGAYPDGVSWVGAYDMAGNAMEWVQDWLSSTYYKDSPKDDPTGAEKGTRKVEKGGWWGSNAYVARSAYRHFEDPPTYQDHHIGFRVVSAEVES